MPIQDENLEQLTARMLDAGVTDLFLKKLAANDNSKQQVYLGGDFAALNILPIGELRPDPKKPNLIKASLWFKWLTEDGALCVAPGAQLILYPQYPEVRFSGFLDHSSNAPSALMRARQAGRMLFMGTTRRGEVIAYVAPHDSPLSREVEELQLKRDTGVFTRIELQTRDGGREQLFHELLRVSNLGWIDPKRLNKQGEILACKGQNCGGLTLEAELGVSQNSLSEPDFMGWEIKSHTVTKLDRPASGGAITLMTPEPTGGVYKHPGIYEFMNRFGYADRTIADRINFGGIHLTTKICVKTSLQLTLGGFDYEAEKITDLSSGILLLDPQGDIAASWEYKDLLTHWMRKHAKAAYVPTISINEPHKQYRYGTRIRVATGTDFLMFIKAVAKGTVYYDPGIKIESASGEKPQVKKRSQFRIRSSAIDALYRTVEDINISKD